jgi:hypothetical protein
VTLNRRFKRIWLEVKKRLIDSVEQTANPGFRSQYAIRFFSWAKKHVGTTRVSVDEIRKVLGLESVKDADGNLSREAPLRRTELGVPLPTRSPVRHKKVLLVVLVRDPTAHR